MKKMIKTLALSAVILLGASTFTACKKGENDPGISLKSRKGRLVGEWKLSKGDDKFTSVGTTSTTTYNGTSATDTYSSGGTDTYNYTETLTIEKDGTYTWKIVEDGDTETTVGRWNFMTANKSAELKNKEAVVFSITSYTSTGTTFTDSNPTDGGIYTINQLKNKELILTTKSTETNNGVSTTYESSMTYIQD